MLDINGKPILRHDAENLLVNAILYPQGPNSGNDAERVFPRALICETENKGTKASICATR